MTKIFDQGVLSVITYGGMADMAQEAAGCRDNRTGYCGELRERPMSSSGRLLVEMRIMNTKLLI